MKNEKPTLLEVKEYFKNAETVESNGIKKLNHKDEYYEYKGSIFIGNGLKRCALVWCKHFGYAKILTYKEPKEETFVISREQIETIYEDGCTYIKEWFPKAFEPEKKELVVGKWYKKDKLLCLIKCIDSPRIYFQRFHCYGFNTPTGYDNFCFDVNHGDAHGFEEATPEEVKEALTKEAMKRGYVEGVWLKKAGSNKHMDQKLKICGNFDWFPSLNILDDQRGNGHIFDNGIWSEIIPTITKEEAEQKLNCKII